MNNFCIIGAGKLAHSFATALYKKKFTINSIIDIQMDTASQLSKKLNNITFTNKIDLIEKSDIVLLMINDSSIKSLVRSICKSNIVIKDKLFIHFSGSLSIDILKPLKKYSAQIASIHPMQTFPSNDLIKLDNVFAAVESDNSIIKDLCFDLCKKLKMQPFEILSKDKTKYHLLGVFASNFLISNLIATQFIANEIENLPNLEKFLFPILQQTIDNVKNNGINKSLSGPIQRGDLITIEKHKSELLSNEILLNVYRQNSLLILEKIKSYKSLPKSKIKILEKLLSN